MHVSAASLKQSVFHHEDDEELTRLLNQENRSPDSPWREPRKEIFELEDKALMAERLLSAGREGFNQREGQSDSYVPVRRGTD